MPNWKKVIVSGSSAELTTLKLTGTSGQSSEATSLMINGDGTIGTRELGSNAFNSNTYNNYSLPLAASGTRGGVKIGFTESGKNYPVELSSEKMFVNVPWTDNNTTYSVGDGGLTQKNFTTTLKNKLDGIAASANNFSIAVGVDSGEGVGVSSGGTVNLIGGTNVTLSQDGETGAVTITSTDNNTTYSVGDGGLTQKNFTSTLKTKLDGIAASATNVTNNNQLTNGAGYITSFTNTVDMGDGFKIANSAGTDQFTVTENEEIRFAGSGATSVAFDSSTQKVTISSTDNNTTYSVGDGGLTQKNFTTTLKNKLDGIAASANNYSMGIGIDGGEASSVTSGNSIDLVGGSNVSLVQDGNSITISSTDTNTTYSAGGGLSLSGTTFSNAGVTSIVAGTDITISGGTGIVTINAASQTDQNFTNADHTKLNGIATSANNYSFGVTVDGDEEAGVTIGNGSNLDISAGSNVSLSQNAETGAITISSTDTNTDTNTTYSAGTGIDLTGTTFSHDNTSGQNSVNNSGNTVIQDVTLDTYGHVTALASKTLSIPSNNNELDNGAGYTTNSGTVTGTGVSNRIARWSGTSAISSVSDLTFDGTTLVAGTDGSTGGRVRTGDGSVSSPAFSFVGDNNTGFYCSTTDTIAATTGGTQRLTINSNGMKVNNGALGVNVNASTTNGRIDASNDIVAYSSDKRLKENIKVIETPLDKLDKLSGFTYNWNEKANKIAGFDKEESMVGVFAQDVESVLPEAVKRAPFDNDGEDGSKSGENYLTVQYEKLVPLLIESIKELKSEIEELKRGK